jgi:excisionase family DNA binding protein
MGVKPDTIYKWIERHKLPGHKIGRLWKFNIKEVNTWVRSRPRFPTNSEWGSQIEEGK